MPLPDKLILTASHYFAFHTIYPLFTPPFISQLIFLFFRLCIPKTSFEFSVSFLYLLITFLKVFMYFQEFLPVLILKQFCYANFLSM